jgi:hypothetical protein
MLAGLRSITLASERTHEANGQPTDHHRATDQERQGAGPLRVNEFPDRQGPDDEEQARQGNDKWPRHEIA